MDFLSDQVRLQCIGSGDAFGSGGRLNSCYHVTLGHHQLLIDCGCSSLIGLQQCGLKASEISTVVVSHLHGDHFGGIPFLLMEGKYASKRQHPLTLIGPVGLQKQVEAALEAFYPGTLKGGFDFLVSYVVLDARKELQIDDFVLKAWRVKHGRSSHVFGLRLEFGGKVISYTGDSEWTETLVALAQGSDLFITECFSYDHPIPSHLDYQTLKKKRNLLDCKKMMLTHMGPEMLSHLDSLNIDVLNDGDILLI